MPRTLPAWLVVLVAVTGCGGGGNNGNGGQKKNTVTVGHNQPIAFGANEFSFEPDNVIVNSGSTQATVVRFVLRNNGTQAHDLHVQKDGNDLGGTPVLAPGGTGSGQATLAPGSYQFVCTVESHAALGMRGTITVTSKKATRPGEKDAGKPGKKK